MKKSFLIVIISAAFIGCSNDSENIKLNQGVKFQEINKIKKKGFNFDKKNSYSKTEKTTESSFNKNDVHQKSCTAACCSEAK